MAKKLKNLRIEEDKVEAIQKLANIEHDGNFTAAVDSLLNQALSMRGICERDRWEMYSSVSPQYKSSGTLEQLRPLLDGLHI